MAVISLPRHSEPENLTEKVAAEVRALMGRYGVTQTALGGILGISQPQASARYHGKVAFKLDELGVLAVYFGVSPAELLGERVSPRPGGPDGGIRGGAPLRARRDSNPKPSDPKVLPRLIAA